MSFLLIDRITHFEPGREARGVLRIPHDVTEFPPCLVTEAVGQLAGYIAMERADFASRPVAAMAGEVRVHGEVRPGATLELAVQASSLKAIGIRYGGVASVGGKTVLEMHRCTGAMLPMAELDYPARVRDEFARLLDGGAPERSLPTRADFDARIEWKEPPSASSVRATLEAPTECVLYAEHFPRRPVYPATLLLDAKIRIASELWRDGPSGTLPALAAVTHVKVRAFTPPGGRVDVTAERVEGTTKDGELAARVEAHAQGERVSSVIVLFRKPS